MAKRIADNRTLGATALSVNSTALYLELSATAPRSWLLFAQSEGFDHV